MLTAATLGPLTALHTGVNKDGRLGGILLNMLLVLFRLLPDLEAPACN